MWWLICVRTGKSSKNIIENDKELPVNEVLL